MDLKKFFELLNTEGLLTFLKEQKIQKLHLDEDDFSILRKNKVSGTSFLYADKLDFKEAGLTVFRSVELNNFGNKIISSKYDSVLFIKNKILILI